MVHFLCRDVQTNPSPKANESDGVYVVDTNWRQFMCGDKRNESRDHDRQTKDCEFFANLQKRLTLFSSSCVANVAYGAENESHEQPVQAGIKHDMAKNSAKRLHAGVDCLLKAESRVCFHF